MIGKELENKIDKTVAATIESELLNVDDAIDPVVDETLQEQPYQPEFLEADEPPTPVEPNEVAGLGSVINKASDAIKQRAKEAEKRVTMEGDVVEPIRRVDNSLVIAPADPDEVKAINQQLGGEYAKGLNFPAIFTDGTDGGLDVADYLAKFKDANKDLFESARRGTIPFDKMLEMAEARGLNDIVYKMADRAPGEVMPPEDFLAGMLAYSQLYTQTRGAWKKAFDMPLGPEREAAMQNALQLATVHAHVAANLSGAVSEAARTLQLAGELQTRGIPSVVEELTLFGAKTSQEIEYVGRHYLAITNPNAQMRFLAKAANNKKWDAMTEIWINAILSSPITHVVNIAGNTVYGQLTNLETLLAAGIGKARTTLGIGGSDRVRARESLAQLQGLKAAFLDAFIMAGRVAITEAPTDLASKIDVRTRRAISAEGDKSTGDLIEIYQQFKNGNAGPGAVNALGVWFRMSSRAMLAEDEFFKAIAGRAELYRQAEIRALAHYDLAISQGATKEKALQEAALERANIINNPPENIQKTVRDAARQLTFQADLDGFLGSLQGATNHPLIKLFVPFYKTPVNVMKATFERSPAMLLYPKFWEKVASGGRDADIALSRFMLGSVTFGGLASMALTSESGGDFFIMGSGPSNKNARAAMRRLGILPYSMNFKNEDGSYTSVAFTRFDPVSGVLAMAADFAYYAQYEDDTKALEELSIIMSIALGELVDGSVSDAISVAGESVPALARTGEVVLKASVTGLGNYAMQMPMLSVLSEFQGIAQSDATDKMDQILALLTQKGMEAGASVVPGMSSFGAGFERITSPEAKNIMLPAEGLRGEDVTQLPKFMQGFYQALQRLKSRNPYYNADLPPRLTEWAEPMYDGQVFIDAETGQLQTTWWDFVNPVKYSKAYATTRPDLNLIDAEMMELGDGITRTPRTIDGVLLNGEQYNKWIELTNAVDAEGDLPGSENFDPSTTLVPALGDLIRQDYYQQLPTKAQKIEAIKNLHKSYRGSARAHLLEEDDGLQFKVDAVQ